MIYLLSILFWLQDMGHPWYHHNKEEAKLLAIVLMQGSNNRLGVGSAKRLSVKKTHHCHFRSVRFIYESLKYIGVRSFFLRKKEGDS